MSLPEPTPPDVLDPRQSPRLRLRLARLVAEVLSPVLVVGLLLIVVAWHSTLSGTAALGWAALSFLFSSVLPGLYIVREVRRGHLTDHHLFRREQRLIPFLIWIVSTTIGLGLLLALGAPRELVALVGAMATSLVVFTAINLFWKLSVHTGTVAGAAVVVHLAFGPAILPLAAVVGLVAWSRVEMGAHSVGQVVAGATLGGAITAAVFATLQG